mmetsp:Transcript_17733/g.44640  ORF Transcript_17733/g.44640 Transcript_17733/m.44640 type:complete len:303 (+) Transcript_17733:1625-2533(+)
MPPSLAAPPLVTSKQPLRLTWVMAGRVDRLSTPRSLSPAARAKFNACRCWSMDRLDTLPESVQMVVPSRLRDVSAVKEATTASNRSSTFRFSGSFKLPRYWQPTLSSSSCCFRLSAGCSAARVRSKTINAGKSSATTGAWSLVGARHDTIMPWAMRHSLHIMRTTRTSCQERRLRTRRSTGGGSRAHWLPSAPSRDAASRDTRASLQPPAPLLSSGAAPAACSSVSADGGCTLCAGVGVGADVAPSSSNKGFSRCKTLRLSKSRSASRMGTAVTGLSSDMVAARYRCDKANWLQSRVVRPGH